MRPRPIHIILFFAGILFTSIGLSAQDRIPVDPVDQERSSSSEVIQEESRPSIGNSQSTYVQSDTTAYRASEVQGQRSGDKPKSQEEDVLSFHFLYYILQKFKMSDIVDK